MASTPAFPPFPYSSPSPPLLPHPSPSYVLLPPPLPLLRSTFISFKRSFCPIFFLRKFRPINASSSVPQFHVPFPPSVGNLYLPLGHFLPSFWPLFGDFCPFSFFNFPFPSYSIPCPAVAMITPIIWAPIHGDIRPTSGSATVWPPSSMCAILAIAQEENNLICWSGWRWSQFLINAIYNSHNQWFGDYKTKRHFQWGRNGAKERDCTGKWTNCYIVEHGGKSGDITS